MYGLCTARPLAADHQPPVLECPDFAISHRPHVLGVPGPCMHCLYTAQACNVCTALALSMPYPLQVCLAIALPWCCLAIWTWTRTYALLKRMLKEGRRIGVMFISSRACSCQSQLQAKHGSKLSDVRACFACQFNSIPHPCSQPGQVDWMAYVHCIFLWILSLTFCTFGLKQTLGMDGEERLTGTA